ncbi:MAG: hypothetical protein M1822_005956 [Bathelium mastoideum]|nr:MAG: hypothetical protein M1822_005956 [Bathelium mastoideum]
MDGLSVAASVAGIVSLGIQVTQSLVDFYSAYKDQKSDTVHTLKKLERLLGVLEILRTQISERTFISDEQALLKNIEGSVQVCEEYIQDLQSETEKVRGESRDGIRAAARTAAYRVAYPFRQSTLHKLDENIEEIVSHISFALQLLGRKDVHKVQSNIEDTKALLELVRADQISSEIREWLKAPDATINYNEACKKRHDGTGLWLVTGSSFSSWLGKSNSFLWLHGFAGCGKSVLCCTAIQHTLLHRRSNPRVGIAFFFFAFNDAAKQECSAMLRALVLQLLGQLGRDHEPLLRLHDRYHNAIPPDQALMDYLHQLILAFDDVYIILDALDECPRNEYRRDVLKALVDLRVWSEPSLHLLVTSREEPDIRDVLIDEVGALPDETISMKNDSVDKDIAFFIFGALENDRQLRKWEKYHDQIEKALTERAKGVFRWVECQFTALRSGVRSKRQLDNILASLPPNLDRTPEIIEGIAVELGPDPQLNIAGRLDDEDDILRICPGLIEIDFHASDNRAPKVRITHFSVQEYLESDRIHQHEVAAFGIKKREAHAKVVSICLTYLEAVSISSVSEYPLAFYAAKNWWRHYLDADQNLYQVEDQAVHLFQDTGGEFEKWWQLFEGDFRGRRPRGEVPSPFYYPALLGLESVFSRLLYGKPPTGPENA